MNKAKLAIRAIVKSFLQVRDMLKEITLITIVATVGTFVGTFIIKFVAEIVQKWTNNETTALLYTLGVLLIIILIIPEFMMQYEILLAENNKGMSEKEYYEMLEKYNTLLYGKIRGRTEFSQTELNEIKEKLLKTLLTHEKSAEKLVDFTLSYKNATDAKEAYERYARIKTIIKNVQNEMLIEETIYRNSY